jgi:CRISPR system Cascade subunit CasC
MPDGDMVQVHMLTAYPASLLNRDDAGLAKRIPFGGAYRTRISSQCLKKHWRDAAEVASQGGLAVRSRHIYERMVRDPLVADQNASEEEAGAIAKFLVDTTLSHGNEEKAKQADPAQTGQVIVLTQEEARWLGEVAAEILRRVRDAGGDAADAKEIEKHAGFKKKDKGVREQLKSLPASVDTALFGRMVTSDLFSRVDSAVSVAHAFTTHAEDSETDYFTAVDTLKSDDDDAGAGLIQETELTSGVYYLYVVIDMNQLRGNLGGDAAGAESLARSLVRAMATTSPGAKRGSTAPYAYAEFVLLERGGQQPRTLANAFRDAVSAEGGDMVRRSIERLADYRHAMQEMYGAFDGRARVASVHSVEGIDAESGTFESVLAGIFPE